MQRPWLEVQDLSDRFGWSADHRDSEPLKRAVAGACALVERELERRVGVTRYVRRFNGNGAKYLPLPFPPIVTVDRLMIHNELVEVGTADDGYADHAVAFWDHDKLHRLCGFPTGLFNVRVEWSAGYAIGRLPEHIKRLTETAAGILFLEKRRVGETGKQAGKGGSVTYLRDLEGIEASALEIERDWRGLYLDVGVPLPGDGGEELGVFELGGDDMG